MLSTFNFQINDSKETISELEGLIFKLERYGLISEFVLNTIFNVFHVIYKKEIKAYVKKHSPEKTNRKLESEIKKILEREEGLFEFTKNFLEG